MRRLVLVVLLLLLCAVPSYAASTWNPQVIPFLGASFAQGQGLVGVLVGPHLDLLQVKNVTVGLTAGAAATGLVTDLTRIETSHIGPGAGVTAVQEKLNLAGGVGYTRADRWFGWIGKSVFEFSL
jgi:hypothetical protein